MDVDTSMNVMILVFLFMMGAVTGSFACCQAWRWRYKIEKQKDLGKRSICLHCKYQLKWYDNIPVISWLMLRGKCRKCHKPIGAAEILSEVGMGAAFALAGWAYLIPIINNWDILLSIDAAAIYLKLGEMVGVLAILVVMGILAVYDAKWGELPVSLLIVSNILGAAILACKEVRLYVTGEDWIGGLYSAGFGVLILAGVCYMIYKVSHERLMGGGDWILALAIALAIGDWWLSLWAMFLANLLGDLIMLPTVISTKNSVLHFGPFLVMAYIMVFVLGNALPVLITIDFLNF